jgi:predicted nucleic acid-binding protein
MYLIDTNILLRFTDRAHAQHANVRAAVQKLQAANHEMRITPQNCVEFWNVATRPIPNNGFGLTPADTSQLLHLVDFVRYLPYRIVAVDPALV